jgi:hypothetical protein
VLLSFCLYFRYQFFSNDGSIYSPSTEETKNIRVVISLEREGVPSFQHDCFETIDSFGISSCILKLHPFYFAFNELFIFLSLYEHDILIDTTEHQIIYLNSETSWIEPTEASSVAKFVEHPQVYLTKYFFIT